MTKRKKPSRGKKNKSKKNLGETDVKEEEGLFGVRDLDAVPLVERRVRVVKKYTIHTTSNNPNNRKSKNPNSVLQNKFNRHPTKSWPKATKSFESKQRKLDSNNQFNSHQTFSHRKWPNLKRQITYQKLLFL
jgi:hypothetical protein